MDLEGTPQWTSLDPGASDAEEVRGLVAVLVAADSARSAQAQVAGFLLDVWCLGVKNALPPEPIAQVIALTEPQLIRRLILAGTGPAGGEGIKNVTRISHFDTLRALLTLQDPKQFSSSPAPRTGVAPASSSRPV